MAAQAFMDWLHPPPSEAEEDHPVEEEEELDVQDCHGDTVLHRAVKAALVSTVLSVEPLIEEMDAEGAAMLDRCLRDKSTRDVDGFDISVLRCAHHLHNKHGLMPIHIAASQGATSMCEELLKTGAPINARSLRVDPLVHGRFCCTPRWGRRDEHGELADISPSDKTPLHYAVSLLCEQHEAGAPIAPRDLELVRLLLRKRANVNAADFDGETPFHIAMMGGMHELVTLLAEHGADLTTSGRAYGQKNTALHLAALLKDVRMVELLARRGAAVDAHGRDGWTPLCLAARQGDLDVTTALLAAGADVFAPSSNGKTPLDIATLNSKRGKGAAVLALLQHEVATGVLGIALARAASCAGRAAS